jgi:hypothetical protein
MFAEDSFPGQPVLSEQANPWTTDDVKMVVNTFV